MQIFFAASSSTLLHLNCAKNTKELKKTNIIPSSNNRSTNLLVQTVSNFPSPFSNTALIFHFIHIIYPLPFPISSKLSCCREAGAYRAKREIFKHTPHNNNCRSGVFSRRACISFSSPEHTQTYNGRQQALCQRKRYGCKGRDTRSRH
jgi:hypothetical protein